MIILSIRLFFLAARGMNPEGLPQLSGACLYSNPSLLLSLRVFLTPPSLRTPPLYFALQNTEEEGDSNPPLIAVRYPAYGARQGRIVIQRTFFPSQSPCYTNSLYLFILLSSEKNEPRSAAAVIGLWGSSLRSPSGSAELASLGQSSPFFLRLPCDFTAR